LNFEALIGPSNVSQRQLGRQIGENIMANHFLTKDQSVFDQGFLPKKEGEKKRESDLYEDIL